MSEREREEITSHEESEWNRRQTDTRMHAGKGSECRWRNGDDDENETSPSASVGGAGALTGIEVSKSQ